MIPIEVDKPHAAIWYHFSRSIPKVSRHIMAVSSLAVDEPYSEGRELITAAHRRWFQQVGVDADRLAIVRQVHGQEVRVVDHPGECGEADGLLTDQPDLLLGIRTADCAAVFLVAPEVPAVGLLHVGWRGARSAIVSRAVSLFHQRWGGTPGGLWAAVSPFLRGCCYRVTPEFLDYFPSHFFLQRQGNWFFQFEAALLDALLTAGIPASQITISPWCTACSEYPLHSYRRDKTAQRMYHLIQITDNG